FGAGGRFVPAQRIPVLDRDLVARFDRGVVTQTAVMAPAHMTVTGTHPIAQRAMNRVAYGTAQATSAPGDRALFMPRVAGHPIVPGNCGSPSWISYQSGLSAT